MRDQHWPPLARSSLTATAAEAGPPDASGSGAPIGRQNFASSQPAAGSRGQTISPPSVVTAAPVRRFPKTGRASSGSAGPSARGARGRKPEAQRDREGPPPKTK